MEVSQLRLRRNDAGTPWISRVLAWSHSYFYLKELMGSSLHLISSRSDRDLKCELISFLSWCRLIFQLLYFELWSPKPWLSPCPQYTVIIILIYNRHHKIICKSCHARKVYRAHILSLCPALEILAPQHSNHGMNSINALPCFTTVCIKWVQIVSFAMFSSKLWREHLQATCCTMCRTTCRTTCCNLRTTLRLRFSEACPVL